MRSSYYRYYAIVFLIWMFLPGTALADNCGSLNDCLYTLRAVITASLALTIFAMILSSVLDFTPVVGTIKGVIEAVIGRDLITGQELAWWERVVGVIPIGGALIGGGVAAAKIARTADRFGDLARAADRMTDAAKTADRVNDAARVADRAGDTSAHAQAAQGAGPIQRGIPPRPPTRPPQNPLIEPYGGDLPEGRPPFCPPDERVLASGQHRFAHNLAGDPVVAEGWLYPRNGPRITQPGSRQLHADVTRNTPGLDASHLLADYFGGPDIFQNLIPFPEELNLSQWKKFENNLTELAARNPVYLQAYVVRVPGDFIPERVIYHVYQLQGGQLELIQREFIDLTGFLH